ncbi:MAG: thioesterase family protein [Chitinophagaceae bacterium]
MRIKIQFEKAFTYTTSIPVRITDVNYGGHLGNDTLLSILHEARLHFLAQWQYTEMNIEGVSLIMADCAVQYKAEAFYGNMLHISMFAIERSQVSFDLYYEVKSNDKIIAHAKHGMVCFDYKNRSICELPESFKQKINE